MSGVVEVRSAGNHWDVVVDGVHHSKHRLKRRAEAEGARVARQQGKQLRVQRRDGTFQYHRGYL